MADIILSCTHLTKPPVQILSGAPWHGRHCSCPGVPDPADLNALQHQVQHLPTETLLFLLGSRYCETDRLSDEAWRLFGHTPLGWPRVQAICDFVHNHITFNEHSRATRHVARTVQTNDVNSLEEQLR
jgi:hypothetical protein